MLCDRLSKIYQQALISIKEEEQQPNSVPIAIQLGLKKPPDIRVEEYYPTFLSMAKNFMEGMDGHMKPQNLWKQCLFRHFQPIKIHVHVQE